MKYISEVSECEIILLLFLLFFFYCSRCGEGVKAQPCVGLLAGSGGYFFHSWIEFLFIKAKKVQWFFSRLHNHGSYDDPWPLSHFKSVTGVPTERKDKVLISYGLPNPDSSMSFLGRWLAQCLCPKSKIIQTVNKTGYVNVFLNLGLKIDMVHGETIIWSTNVTFRKGKHHIQEGQTSHSWFLSMETIVYCTSAASEAIGNVEQGRAGQNRAG